MNDLPEQRHVLYVDAEPSTQRTVARLLRAGAPEARVTCVNDGGRALGVLRREPVDLMIVDLALPDMDGVELLRQIANLRIHLPVIAVLADAPPADETGALVGGAAEHVFIKPIEPETFVRGVRDLLEAAMHRSHIEGVSIAGFVQLLAMERATCALRASVPGAQGVLYFTAGTLVDARQAELSSVDAALEIFTWKDPIITLEALTRDRPVTIHVGVTELLLESARLSDERERNLRRARTATAGARGPALSLVPPPTRSSRPASAPMAVATATLGPALASAVESALAPTTGLDLEFAVWPAASAEPAASPQSPAVSPQSPATGAGPRPAAWEAPEVQGAIAGLLVEVMTIDGALAAAVAHWELDQSLGQIDLGGVVRRDAGVAGDCRVMRALMAMMTRLGLDGRVQDILITLEDQTHILWPLARHDGLFVYLAIDRARGNLALTRRSLQKFVEARGL